MNTRNAGDIGKDDEKDQPYWRSGKSRNSTSVAGRLVQWRGEVSIGYARHWHIERMFRDKSKDHDFRIIKHRATK
jgi:hypothetical protein